MGITDELPLGHVGWGEKRSELLRYPDGSTRLVTMRTWYWDALPDLQINGFDLSDLLECAQNLAAEFPSGRGYEFDVIDSTAYMIRSTYRRLVEEGDISS
jgi:hypothetical protein